MTSGYSLIASYPPELLSAICAHIYAAGNPPLAVSLDPLLHPGDRVPTSLPSSYPPAHWSDASVRNSLSSLCLVNRDWHGAAKPWLWHKVEVRLPRSWLALVDELAAAEEELDQEQTALIVGQTIRVAETAALASRDPSSPVSDRDAMNDLHEKVLAQILTAPDGSIPPELLTPLVSRDPSPRRIRPKSKSPARWKLIHSISAAVQDVIERDSPGIYLPPPDDPRLGRYVRHLDFNHFRTIGMRRSVEEGVKNRFVTRDRLCAVLKELPNLLAFGATEYMDGALTSSVVRELLLRGSASRGRGRPSRGRDLVVFDPQDVEAEDCERRREYRELEAIDLTGCVSAVFVNALTKFVNDHLIVSADSASSDSDGQDPRERRRPRSRAEEPLTFPCLQRLGLRGVKSVQSNILNPFILAFPSLTHLDLSCTRVTPDVLTALGTSPTIRLHSLGLERCNWLTGESIHDFLVHAPAARDIRHLSLYGDWSFPSPLSEADLHALFTHAPCFRSGTLAYLDLSSAPVTPALLDACAPQPALRSLGLSHIRALPLGALAAFLRAKAPRVEVLSLVASAPELAGAAPPRTAALALHAQLLHPLCAPPFALRPTPHAAPPTCLRVVELAPSLLASVGAGAGTWRVVKSKGGRGWYVDVASGWIAEGAAGDCLRRDLEPGHPWRVELERLADANGNVSSGVGWHARKMEVLHGHGFLGREAGLYGAVSFAYQG